jgi:hypothetical protein
VQAAKRQEWAADTGQESAGRKGRGAAMQNRKSGATARTIERSIANTQKTSEKMVIKILGKIKNA